MSTELKEDKQHLIRQTISNLFTMFINYFKRLFIYSPKWEWKWKNPLIQINPLL